MLLGDIFEIHLGDIKGIETSKEGFKIYGAGKKPIGNALTYQYETEAITWITTAHAKGRVFYHINEKFNIAPQRGIILAKKHNNIKLKFLYIFLKLCIKKLNLINYGIREIKNIEINFIANEKQDEIIEKFNEIENKFKKQINDLTEELLKFNNKKEIEIERVKSIIKNLTEEERMKILNELI